MRSLLVLLRGLLVLIPTLAACASTSESSPSPPPANPPVEDSSGNESTRLAIGETGNMGKMAVSFLTVDGDNRCPKDVQCIVGGQANVVLRMTDASGASSELRLAVPPGATASAAWGGGAIVVDLEPETMAGVGVELDAYRVVVRWRPDAGETAD